MEKVTYTPAEFAEVFGRERTWGYRQLYAGKVKAITALGRTLIPKSEVDRLLAEAGRYLGAKAKVKKSESAALPAGSKGTESWTRRIKQRKSRDLHTSGAHSGDGRKSSSPKRGGHDASSASRRSVYQRLTRRKDSEER